MKNNDYNFFVQKTINYNFNRQWFHCCLNIYVYRFYFFLHIIDFFLTNITTDNILVPFFSFHSQCFFFCFWCNCLSYAKFLLHFQCFALLHHFLFLLNIYILSTLREKKIIGNNESEYYIQLFALYLQSQFYIKLNVRL